MIMVIIKKVMRQSSCWDFTIQSMKTEIARLTRSSRRAVNDSKES